jgi:hypothetical protein
MKSISEAKWKVEIRSLEQVEDHWWWHMDTLDDIGEDCDERCGVYCKTKSDAETALQEYMKINGIKNWMVVE